MLQEDFKRLNQNYQDYLSRFLFRKVRAVDEICRVCCTQR